MANDGKRFEADFRGSAERYPDISIDRLYDVMGGRKGINNICDYIVYLYPNQYYFELKCYEGQRISLDVLTDNQYTGLLNKYGKPGVIPGVIFNFKIDKEHEEAYFINIATIKQFKDYGLKSVHVNLAAMYGILLEGSRKRTRYDYQVRLLLEKIRLDGGCVHHVNRATVEQYIGRRGGKQSPVG